MVETRDVAERLRGLDHDVGDVISSVLDRAHRDVLSEAADEIEALRAERLRSLAEWQPIETAPKDRTEVLITGIGFRGRRWMSVAKQINGRWYDDSKHAGNLTNVTHWQPLPEPPTP
jgi:hypothetical protein